MWGSGLRRVGWLRDWRLRGWSLRNCGLQGRAAGHRQCSAVRKNTADQHGSNTRLSLAWHPIQFPALKLFPAVYGEGRSRQLAAVLR
jgi:hypothetical protein